MLKTACRPLASSVAGRPASLSLLPRGFARLGGGCAQCQSRCPPTPRNKLECEQLVHTARGATALLARASLALARQAEPRPPPPASQPASSRGPLPSLYCFVVLCSCFVLLMSSEEFVASAVPADGGVEGLLSFISHGEVSFLIYRRQVVHAAKERKQKNNNSKLGYRVGRFIFSHRWTRSPFARSLPTLMRPLQTTRPSLYLSGVRRDGTEPNAARSNHVHAAL